MLAINRIANVNGRINVLIVSIITINNISKNGVPVGIKWAKLFFVDLIHVYRIIALHIGKAILKQVII